MKNRVVVIGASMGGIDALRTLVKALPADFRAPILVTQHISPSSPGFLPAILSRSGPLPASHPSADAPEPLVPGRIYVAPPDRHMVVDDGRVRLSHGPKENFVRPAIDTLFRSAALGCGPAAVGVVLTGMMDDGTAGLLAIKDCGGMAIVQDPEEATAPSMPRSALRHVDVDHCLPLARIAHELVALARDPFGDIGRVPGRRLLDIEDRMARGFNGAEDWQALLECSRASGLNCPLCRSALFELPDTRLLRFRCRAGHAATARNLLGAQAEAHEAQLATLLGLAAEEATLARRFSAMTEAADDPLLVDSLRTRIEFLEQESGQVSGWLSAKLQQDF